MKKISIIIPCFNVADLVRTGWESLKKQTIGLDALECIFVDDASTDNGETWRVLNEIEQEAPESVILIRHEENLRQGGARDTGISYASGKYMLFMDADDMYREDACEALYSKAEEYRADMIVYGFKSMPLGNKTGSAGENQTSDPTAKDGERGTIPGEWTGEPYWEKLYDLEKEPEKRTDFLLRKMCGLGCWFRLYSMDMVRRSGARHPRKMVFEEPMFVYPMYLYADRILMMNEPYYIYRPHENTTSSTFGKRILEHPQVQLQLLEYFMERPEMMEKYSKELEHQFIFSFYAETLLLAYYNRAYIPLDFFCQMQQICRDVFPKAKENVFLREDSRVAWFADSLDREIRTQQELEQFILEAGRQYAGVKV